MDIKKILIIGGGFGGIRVALDLDKKFSTKKADITLVDKNNSHLFLPALYEVGSAVSTPIRGGKPKGLADRNLRLPGKGIDCYQVPLRKTVNIPYADIFEGTKVNFIQAAINGIDLEKKEAYSGGERIFYYDYLVLGLGAETDTFGIPGVSEYAYKFKTLDEALFLNQKIKEAFHAVKEERRSPPVRFIVVGGGFNGIELAAELAGYARNLQIADQMKEKCYGLKVIEAAIQILPMVSVKERKIIKDRLGRLRVEILESRRITEVAAEFVQADNGLGEKEKHEADFIIWTAGIRANSFLKNIFGLRLDEKGKTIVNNFLQADGWSNVFSIGDNTVLIDEITKKPIPGLAYVAVDEGKIVAENISRLIKNKPLKAYKPFYSVWIAPVGGKFAVAHLTNWLTISGFLGWMIREWVDLRYFLSILPFSKALSLLNKEIRMFTKND